MANPIHIPAVFSAGGIKNQIQKTLQSGQDPQDATWVNGWGGITMVPIEDGGKAPKGQDFNGVLNAICDHTVFNQNGGQYQWSQSVIDNYGGYAKDAIIQSDDGLREYRSLVNSNTVNPNNGIGLTWLVYSGDGSLPIASSTTAGITKVVNALNSTDVASALSAAQGRILSSSLNDSINNLRSELINKDIGINQTATNVTSSRSTYTTYVNNLTKPIFISIVVRDNGSVSDVNLYVGGTSAVYLPDLAGANAGYVQISYIIPPLTSYRLDTQNILTHWSELR